MVAKKVLMKRVGWVSLVVFVIVLSVAGVLWNRYLNKNSLLRHYESPNQQDVFLLGTMHKEHFNKWFNYSIADVLSVVEHVQPDVVFLEARADVFAEYGVVDGPVDMAVVYSYCMDHGIAVEMMDWWIVDNDFKSNSTNDRRDDMIFDNIQSGLGAYDEDTTVLVVCGSGHFYEQASRLTESGFERVSIARPSDYFSDDEAFAYPESVDKVWEARAFFYAYTYPEVIAQTPGLNEEIKAEFTAGNHDGFYFEQMKYCELFDKDALYEGKS